MASTLFTEVENRLELIHYTYKVRVKIEKFIKDVLGISAEVRLTSNGLDKLDVVIYDKNKTIAAFHLTEMPGCCAHLISHQMYIHYGSRGKGLAQFLQGIKEELAKNAGYVSMYCTTVAQNEVENHILQKFGWREIDRVVNRRTGNTVITWKKEIDHGS